MQHRHDAGAHAPSITFVEGDITQQDVDAIVNAANSSLLGGGGVDGAIHRAGGAAILEECRALRASELKQGLRPGHAVATTAGNLIARRVIHTVGPIWRGGTQQEAETLSNAYRNCIRIATREGLRSIAFPSISTGAYGYPVREAADVALETVREICADGDASALDEIRFVLHSRADYETYVSAASSRVSSREGSANA